MEQHKTRFYVKTGLNWLRKHALLPCAFDIAIAYVLYSFSVYDSFSIQIISCRQISTQVYEQHDAATDKASIAVIYLS